MSDLDPFDMDFDGDVDGVDFLGFDHLTRHVMGIGDEEDGEEHDICDDEDPW